MAGRTGGEGGGAGGEPGARRQGWTLRDRRLCGDGGWDQARDGAQRQRKSRDHHVRDLPEGRNLVRARAISGASVPATDDDVGSTEIDVDKTAPDVSVAGAPDPGEWRRGPVALTLTGTDQAQLSGLREVEYRVDGAQPIAVPSGSTPGVQSQTVSAPVTADGRHTVTFRAVDFAGNSSPEKTIQFKVDQTPPELVAFEAQDPSQPSAISVAVSDRTSGIAGGVIEFRKQGDAGWTELATQFGGDHLFATVDDSSLEPGTYEFQAKVQDVAGNQTVSNRRRDGRIELLQAPFRFDTRMTAGIVTAASQVKLRKVSARCRRSKKCMAKVRKQRRKADRRTPLVTGTVPTLTVPYGKTAVVKGVLRSSDGQPIAGQAVDVYQRLESTGQPEVRVATVKDQPGRQLRIPRGEGAEPERPLPVRRQRDPPPGFKPGEAPGVGKLDAEGQPSCGGQRRCRDLLGKGRAAGGRRPEDRRSAGLLPRQVRARSPRREPTRRATGATGIASRRRADSFSTSSASGCGARRAIRTSSATRRRQT